MARRPRVGRRARLRRDERRADTARRAASLRRRLGGFRERCGMNGVRRLIAATVITVTVFGAGVAGYALHGQNGPRSCTFGGSTIPSGDAGRTGEGTTWVCTDGTLV